MRNILAESIRMSCFKGENNFFCRQQSRWRISGRSDDCGLSDFTVSVRKKVSNCTLIEYLGWEVSLKKLHLILVHQLKVYWFWGDRSQLFL